MASIGGAQLERRSQSMVLEEDRGSPADEELMVRSQGGNCEVVGGGDALRIGAVLDNDSVAPKSCPAKHEPSGKSLIIRIRPSRPSAIARAMTPVFFTRCQTVEVHADMDLMKEKFAKLLLGEDMSGSGKGVPSALALSNAVTNLAGDDDVSSDWVVSVYKDPMHGERRAWISSHVVSLLLISVRLWRATEAGAHGPGQEGEMEEGGRLASLRR
jgi:hypothetical protein